MSKYLDNLKQLCRETDICRETARMVLKVNVPELIQEIEKLQSQLARYEETLKFYGDQSNYCRQPAEEGEFRTPVLRDMGQHAREVLNVKD